MAGTIFTLNDGTFPGPGRGRRSFLAAGLYWLFYGDGTDLFYRTFDGVTWSAATSVGASIGTVSADIVVHFDGTFMHYLVGNGVNNTALFYRRGTPNSDGTITWSAAEQTAGAAAAAWDYIPEDVRVDSNGRPWILYGYKDDVLSKYQLLADRSSTTDGTWSSDTGFPHLLYEGAFNSTIGNLCPMSANQMYVVYWKGDANNKKVHGVLYNSTWGAEETVCTDLDNTTAGSFASAVIGDVIYLVYRQDAAGMNSKKYTGSWADTGAPSAVSSAGVAVTACPGSRRVIAFWYEVNKVYYSVYSNAWSTKAVLVDETVDTITGTQYISALPVVKSGKSIVFYSTLAVAPYNARFEVSNPISVVWGGRAARTLVTAGILQE